MAFGKEIKRLRLAAGLTSDKMATILGIDNVERYRNWEKRDTNPKFPDLTNIEQVFNMPLEKITELKALPKKMIPTGPSIEPDPRIDTRSDKAIELINHAPKGKFKKKIEPGKLIDFYDTDFAAGDIEFFDDHTVKPAYTMDVPEFSGCTAFRTYGNSMEKLIKSGSILFARDIEDWNSHLEFGQIYAIVCTDKRRYLKYIRKGKDESHFLLKSENKEEYDDFLLPKSKIKSIWLIHGWINKRT